MLTGKEEEDHSSSSSRCTHLPDDILEMIMKRLNLMDYLGMRAVCSPWRATVTKAIANKHCHPLPELPLLLLYSQKKSILPSRFFSISTARVCFLKRPLPERLCHGTVEGWMILSINVYLGSKIIFFLNPVTNAIVLVLSLLNLPSKSPIPNRFDLYMGKMVASSNPTCSNCVLAGLFTDYCHIIYRRHSDKSWTMIEADKNIGNFMDVEIFDSYKLYVRTDRLNSIIVYDLQDSSHNPPKPKVFGIVPEIRPLPVSRTIGNQIHVRGQVFCYLTKDNASGELLVIYLFYNAVYEAEHVGYMKVIKQYVSPPQITKAEVFKLDTSNEETKKWVKVDSLGDRVLFLGHCKCFVMSREALNSTEECAENSIYFNLPDLCPSKPWGGTQLGMLCLTDNSIKYFSMEDSGLKIDAEPFWFLPSAW